MVVASHGLLRGIFDPWATNNEITEITLEIKKWGRKNPLHSEEVEKEIYNFLKDFELKSIEFWNDRHSEKFCLNFGDLQLTSLPNIFHFECISNRLEKLNLNGNDFVSLELNLKNCQKLKEVNLSSCRNLNFLNFNGSSSLEKINCSNTQLSFLEIKNENLRELNCSNSEIRNLQLECPKLEILSCFKNPLSKLDLTFFPNLKEIYCFSMNLNSLDFSKNPNMEVIHCYDNQNLIFLNLGQVLYLMELDCSNTQVNDFNLNGQFSSLWKLNCSNTNMTSLNPYLFPTLRELNFSQNEIDDFNPHICVKLEDVDFSQTTVKSLNFELNRNLIRLNCFQAKKLASLKLNPEIQILNCSDTGLEELDLTSCSNLRELDFSKTMITSINLGRSLKVEVLNSSYTRVTLDLEYHARLQILKCAFCEEVECLDLHNSKDLKEIDCTFALNLKSLNIKRCFNLQRVICTSLNADALEIPKHLRVNALPGKYLKSSIDLNEN